MPKFTLVFHAVNAVTGRVIAHPFPCEFDNSYIAERAARRFAHFNYGTSIRKVEIKWETPFGNKTRTLRVGENGQFKRVRK